MNMPSISLAIFGNRISSAGYEPLYWLNSPPFPELPNLGYPGMAENPYYFVVHNGASYTQFTLVHNNVKSYMAARPGMLKIAISLPYGYALANQVSPFDLLLKIRETFVRQCMTPIAGVQEGYNFKERMADESVSVNLLAQYPLVPYRVAYRPMTGTGKALLLAEWNTIRLLFRDTHYAEFTPYGEVVVAPRGIPTEYSANLQGLEIPRKLNLRLYVNGTYQPWPVQNFYAEPIQIATSYNARVYEPLEVRFTVAQLMQSTLPVGNLSADGYGYRVDLDTEREIVNVKINPRPRVTQVRVAVEGAENPAALIPRLKVSVANGMERPLDANACFTLRGEELLVTPVAKYLGDDYILESQNYADGVLHVRLQKRRLEVRSGALSGSTSGRTRNVTVTLWIMDPKDIRDLNRTINIYVRNTQANRMMELPQRFDRESSPQGVYVTRFQLPAEFAGDVNISFTTDAVSHEGHLHLNPGENVVQIKPEQTKSLTFFKRYARVIVAGLIVLAAAFALLLFSFGVYKIFFSKKDKENTEQTDSLQRASDDTLSIMTPAVPPSDVIATEVESVMSVLRNPRLTFDDVFHLGARISENPNLPDSVVQRVNGYLEIVRCLRTGNVDGADKLQTEHHYLLPVHERFFKAIWSSYVDGNGHVVNYKTTAVGLKAKAFFKKSYREYNSFVEYNEKIPYNAEVAKAQKGGASASPNPNGRGNTGNVRQSRGHAGGGAAGGSAPGAGSGSGSGTSGRGASGGTDER